MNTTNDKNSFSLVRLFLKARTVILLIFLIVLFSILSPAFLTVSSMITVVKHAALYSLIAIGMTFVIVTAGIDLSVGSVVGFSGMVAGWLITYGVRIAPMKATIFFNIPAIVVIVLVIGALIGILNGFIIYTFSVPPFIATLGSELIFRGFAQLISGGATFPNLSGKSEFHNMGFQFLGSGKILGLPTQIWIAVLFSLIAIYILKRTCLGLHIYSVGGNMKAAQLSGVNVRKILLFVYALSGVCAAMAGLITTSQLVAAHPATGEMWETNAIAAAVLGGTSMSGGVGTVGGSIVGALAIGVLTDGMAMVGISEFWQKVIKGAVIIIAVIFDTWQSRMKSKLAVKDGMAASKASREA